MAKRISGEEFGTVIADSDKLVIVDFYSDTCVPCKKLSPVLAEVEEEYADKVNIVKINVAYDTEVAKDNGVMSAPTLLFFKAGREIDRIRGAVPKKSIVEIIEKSEG